VSHFGFIANFKCIIAHCREGHINNLFNTTFWALVQLGGMDAQSAEKELSVSVSYKFFVMVWRILMGYREH
jgi:tRNA(His) 5'-end guanylyltransferase